MVKFNSLKIEFEFEFDFEFEFESIFTVLFVYFF